MYYNSYLSASVVKQTCRDYKTYLKKENEAYTNLIWQLNAVTQSCGIAGEIKAAIDERIKRLVTEIGYLTLANDSDIADCDTLMELVGDETYDGTIILPKKADAYRRWEDNNRSAGDCDKNAYQATDKQMEDYWKGEASHYRGLASNAWDEYDFYYQKEKKYDEINTASSTLFKSSIDYRNAAIAINSFKDYFPSGVYKPTEVETIHLGVDGLSAEALEELLSTSNMSIDDIMELIALQHAPAGSLPPAGQARLEELQQQLLNSNPAAWGLYVTYQGPQNDTIKEFMQLLKDAGYMGDYVYVPNQTKVESWVEQLSVYEGLLAADPTGPYSNFYRNQIDAINNNLQVYCDNSISNANHSEEFTNTYAYLQANGYSQADLALIVQYWTTVDDGDLAGVAMPPEWCEAHLNLPDGLQITEDNCIDMEDSAELKDWYYQGFFVIELLSGQPYSNDGQGYSAAQVNEFAIIDANNPTQFDDLYHNWYDYQFGAVCDYVTGVNSVRATKYALGEYIFPFVDYGTQDYYNAYTNTEDTLYLFSIEAYIAESGRTEEYYEGFDIFGNIVNREKQILVYLREDVANGNIKTIDDYSDAEKAMFLIEYNSTSASDYGCPDFMSMDSLAVLLEHELEGCGVRSYRIEGNTLYITFAGDEDGYGNEFPDQELAFQFDTTIDAFGKKYVTMQEFSNVAAQIAVKQVEGDFYMSDLARENLEKNAVAILCQTGGFTEDQLYNLPEDEYNQLIMATEEVMLANGMMERFQSGRLRVVEGVYQAGKEVTNSVSQLLAFASFLCPGVNAITIASEVTSIADSLGDAYFGEADLSDLKTIAMSLVNIGSEVWDGKTVGDILSAISNSESSVEDLITIGNSLGFSSGEFEINKDTADAFKDLWDKVDKDKLAEELRYKFQ